MSECSRFRICVISFIYFSSARPSLNFNPARERKPLFERLKNLAKTRCDRAHLILKKSQARESLKRGSVDQLKLAIAAASQHHFSAFRPNEARASKMMMMRRPRCSVTAHGAQRFLPRMCDTPFVETGGREGSGSWPRSAQLDSRER